MVTMIHKTKGFVCHHIPKTGGTSIGNWMSNNIGSDVYWVGSRGVRTLTRDAKGEMFLDSRDVRFNSWAKWWNKHAKDINGFPPHMRVSHTKAVITRNKRTKHLKPWHFTFLRNPYDWVTSLFWYRRKMRSPMDRFYKQCHDEADPVKAFDIFLTCLKNRDPKFFTSDPIQSFWINSELDFMGDFSQLEQDFKKIMSLFDIEVTDFPKVNVQPSNRIVRLWKHKSLIDKATELLAKDIKLYETTFNKKATYE